MMKYKVGSFVIYDESANKEGILTPNGIKYDEYEKTFDCTSNWHIAKIISIEENKVSIQHIEASGWKRSKHKNSGFYFFAFYPHKDLRIVRKESIRPLEFFNKRLLMLFCDDTDRIEIKTTHTKRELISLITRTAKKAFAEVEELCDPSRLKKGQVVIRNHRLPCVVDELDPRPTMLYFVDLMHASRGKNEMSINNFNISELRALKDVPKDILIKVHNNFIGPIGSNTKAEVIQKINRFYRSEYKKVIQQRKAEEKKKEICKNAIRYQVFIEDGEPKCHKFKVKSVRNGFATMDKGIFWPESMLPQNNYSGMATSSHDLKIGIENLKEITADTKENAWNLYVDCLRTQLGQVFSNAHKIEEQILKAHKRINRPYFPSVQFWGTSMFRHQSSI